MRSDEFTIKTRTGDFTLKWDLLELAQISQQHGQRNKSNVQLLVDSWLALLADSSLCSTGLKPRSLFSRFRRQLTTDLFGVIKHFTWLHDLLISNLQDSVSKSVKEDLFRHFAKTPIFKEFHAFWQTGDPVVLRYISSFLLLGKKVVYDNKSFDRTALRGWVATEKRLRQLNLPDWVDQLKPIIKLGLGSTINVPWLPKHGSGYVAERGGKDILRKNSLLYFDDKASYFLKMASRFVDIGRILPDSTDEVSGDPRYLGPVSRLKFVPKNWKTSRSISMERSVYQYMQQCIYLGYERQLADGFFGKFIKLSDQGHNRLLSELGSIYSSPDTIDLSSASDSVHIELVRRIYPPGILKYLLVSRSNIVETPKGRVKAIKFAPMGSALCFPVQSTIFLSIVLMAGIMWYEGHSTPDTVDTSNVSLEYLRKIFRLSPGIDQRRLQCPGIYGDDIICDARITSIVTRLLHESGFVVNAEKSFMGPQHYRESCGGHYYLGSDVTPLTFKVNYQGVLTPESVQNLCDLALRCYDLNYKKLRLLLIRYLMWSPIQGVKPGYRKGKRLRNPIAFSDNRDQSYAVFSKASCTNSHLLKRVYDGRKTRSSCSRFQRDEVRCLGGAHPEDVAKFSFENYYYVQWMRSRFRGTGNPLDIVDGSYRETSVEQHLRWRWMPV